jgi:hypothetical protein
MSSKSSLKTTSVWNKTWPEVEVVQLKAHGEDDCVAALGNGQIWLGPVSVVRAGALHAEGLHLKIPLEVRDDGEGGARGDREVARVAADVGHPRPERSARREH